MKVLVVAEGKHEAGTDDVKGALLVLIERVLDCRLTLTYMSIRDEHFRVHGGFEKRILRCLTFARGEQFDALVLVVDEDGDRNRRRIFDQAQDDPRIDLRRALGLAIITFDAWMLADEVAISDVLGVTVQRQPDPETIADPKARCAELLEHSDAGMSQTQLYSKIAEALTINVLVKRSPNGFGPFHERLLQLKG